METVKSIFIWAGLALLIICWLPLLAVRRLFDRDPARYKTGRLFRKLGKMMSKINFNWKISISGKTDIDDRRPFVVVCNHLSQADIPLISNLPWEMKWVAKKELFDIPVVGWMMKLAEDIPVDRHALNRKEATFERAARYLSYNCSVMFFPEGTRSVTGKLNAFTRGAFELAIREQIPLLPLVIDGTQNALPKRSWKFRSDIEIRLKVLNPVSTEGLNKGDTGLLVKKVRAQIVEQLSEWRQKPVDAIDSLAK